MSTEHRLRHWIVSALSPLDAMPVENPAKPGTPDVEHILGWIEVKQAACAPTRPDTPLVIDHYTTQQRLWARERHKKGGSVFMVLQVGRELLILPGPTAAALLNFATMDTLRNLAVEKWLKRPTPKEFFKAVLRCSALPRPKPSWLQDAAPAGGSVTRLPIGMSEFQRMRGGN
jgi:hypothetical protein